MPAFDTGWVEQLLSLVGALESELAIVVGHWVFKFPSHARRSDDQLGRPLDPGKPGVFEEIGVEENPQNEPDVAAGLVVSLICS